MGEVFKLDEPTKNLLNYVNDTGVNLKNVSTKTGIPYSRLRASLSKSNCDRDLKVGEFWMICHHLGLNPEMFFPQE